MNALNFKQFKMHNPDLDILTMVTEFISTLYYAKYKKKLQYVSNINDMGQFSNHIKCQRNL